MTTHSTSTSTSRPRSRPTSRSRSRSRSRRTSMCHSSRSFGSFGSFGSLSVTGLPVVPVVLVIWLSLLVPTVDTTTLTQSSSKVLPYYIRETQLHQDVLAGRIVLQNDQVDENGTATTTTTTEMFVPYDIQVPPRTYDDERPVVRIGLNVFKIKSISIATAQMELNLWLRMSWKDPRLAWDPADERVRCFYFILFCIFVFLYNIFYILFWIVVFFLFPPSFSGLGIDLGIDVAIHTVLLLIRLRCASFLPVFSLLSPFCSI